MIGGGTVGGGVQKVLAKQRATKLRVPESIWPGHCSLGPGPKTRMVPRISRPAILPESVSVPGHRVVPLGVT
jgi:hypothetical protein